MKHDLGQKKGEHFKEQLQGKQTCVNFEQCANVFVSSVLFT